ncbi:MAG: hypothetical protein ACQEXJ_07625 [Myxococcota bacterium]
MERLATGGFDPPHPTTLPEGTPMEVWTALTGRTDADRAALATSIVDPPDPAEDPDLATRTLELLLLVPAEHDRAARLLERLAPRADADQVALWRFRLAAAEIPDTARDDAEAWEALLASLRELDGRRPDLSAVGLRVAAAGLLSAKDAHGADWLAPVLDGRRVVNRAAALGRRPALREALAPAIEWLERADHLAPSAADEPVETALSEVEALDTSGRLEEGTEHLLEILARSGDRPDLARAAGARAALLLAPSLAAQAVAHGAEAEAPDTEALRALARRPLPSPEVTPPTAPETRWTARARSLGSAPAPPEDTEALAFLEAAGSIARAARGWLGRGTDEGLLQAWRLADDLSGDDRAALVAALTDRVPDDELVLAGDEAGHRLGRALRTLLPEGAALTWQTVRLRVSRTGPDEGTSSPANGTAQDPDDPHSPANRLAAAGELWTADRPDAAGAIVASLLRRLEDPEVTPHLLRLALRLLALESPPEGIVPAAERAILAGGPVGEALLERLARAPLAAHPLHAALHRAALDRRRSDALRVRLLEAWLGIWRATNTPPEPSSLTDLMHADAALAPLAAARLASRRDPVADAAAFLAEHPPLETPPSTWADSLLALCRGG